MLNDLERKVVEKVEEGLIRWKIAEELGLGESTVREVIRRLCERYDCPMRDLPERVEEEEEKEMGYG